MWLLYGVIMTVIGRSPNTVAKPIDPLPDRASPLPHRLTNVERLEPFVPTREKNPTAHSLGAELLHQAIIHLTKGNRRSAHHCFDRALKGVIASDENTTLVYGDQKGGFDKKITRYGPKMKHRLRPHGITSDFFIKDYGDPDLMLRLAYLCKALYWERWEAPRTPFPEGEVLDYTLLPTMKEEIPGFLVSLMHGETVEQELHAMRTKFPTISRRADLYRDVEDAHLQGMLTHTHRLLHYLTRDDKAALAAFGEIPEYLVAKEQIAALLSRTQPEYHVEKFKGDVHTIFPDASLRQRLATGRDAHKIEKLLAPDATLPFVDPKCANFAGERNIDLERAIISRRHPSTLFAHIWHDPSFLLSLEERLAGLAIAVKPYAVEEPAMYAGVFAYLARQTALGTQGFRAATPDDESLVRHRYGGFCSQLQQLCALPEMRKAYPTAHLYADMDVSLVAGCLKFL